MPNEKEIKQLRDELLELTINLYKNKYCGKITVELNVFMGVITPNHTLNYGQTLKFKD